MTYVLRVWKQTSMPLTNVTYIQEVTVRSILIIGQDHWKCMVCICSSTAVLFINHINFIIIKATSIYLKYL